MTKFSKYDTVEILDSNEMINEYVNDLKTEDDPRILDYATGVIARAKMLNKITVQNHDYFNKVVSELIYDSEVDDPELTNKYKKEFAIV